MNPSTALNQAVENSATCIGGIEIRDTTSKNDVVAMANAMPTGSAPDPVRGTGLGEKAAFWRGVDAHDYADCSIDQFIH